MTIDTTISLGSISEIVVLIAGGLVTVGMIRQTVKDMRVEVKGMQAELVEIRKALVQLAVQDARINRLEQDYRDMKRGKGLVGVRMVKIENGDEEE